MNSTNTEERCEFLTVDQAATILGVAPVTIRRRVAAGQLPALQLGGPNTAIRIRRDALDLPQAHESHRS